MKNNVKLAMKCFYFSNESLLRINGEKMEWLINCNLQGAPWLEASSNAEGKHLLRLRCVQRMGMRFDAESARDERGCTARIADDIVWRAGSRDEFLRCGGSLLLLAFYHIVIILLIFIRISPKKY